MQCSLIVPTDPNLPYEMSTVAKKIVDADGGFFEIMPHFAPNILCAFARIDGRPVGVRTVLLPRSVNQSSYIHT